MKGGRHAVADCRAAHRACGRATATHGTARQRDRRHGDGRRQVGYVLGGSFAPQEEALESVYYRSDAEHFPAHPDDLDELIRVARVLRNPHAKATTGVDLQVPAILAYLERHGLKLRGTEVMDIGSWQGRCGTA